MTITERIAAAIKPILDEHARESRERIGQLERDINEARAHLQTAKEVCERLTKQAPQTQQDGPWCIIGVTSVKGTGKRIGVVYDGRGGWCEDGGEMMMSRRVADEAWHRVARDPASDDVECLRIVTVSEWVAIYTRANGPVTT